MAKKIILLFFLIILGLSVSEIILRVYYSTTKSKTTLVWQPDPYVGQRLKPNQTGIFVSPTQEYKTQISTNSEGWRDVEHTIDKPENTYRILFLGDSFVENFQVPLDKTFFRQIQNNIPSANGKNIEVITTGLGNTGTAQQLPILENYSLKYHPDLVIQMFLTANDVKNNSPILQNEPYMPYYKIENNNLVEIPFQTRDSRNLSNFKNFLEKFELVQLLLNVRQKLNEKKDANTLGYPIDYHVYDINESKDYELAWEVTKKLILKTKEDVENSGGKYILVTLANNEQVNKNVWTQLLKTYPKMDNSKMDLEKPDKILSDFCKSENLTCWQMLGFFQDYINSHPDAVTHYHYDGHWNELGTNLAAEFLTKNLKDYFSIK